MTVVSTLKLNPREGLMIADALVVEDYAAFDLVEKIRTYQGPEHSIAIGFSGIQDRQTKIIDRFLQSEIQSNASLTEQFFKNALETQTALIEQKLVAKTSLTLSDLHRETTDEYELSERTIAETKKALNKIRDKYSGPFLTLEHDGRKIDLHRCILTSGTLNRIDSPFESIGAGNYHLNTVLNDFLRNYTRAEQKNIPVIDGLVALLRGVNTASRNLTIVSGIPTLVYVREDASLFLFEGSYAKLASEFVSAYDAGFIPLPELRSGLSNLILKDQSIREANDYLYHSAGTEREEMNLYLRGHPIRSPHKL